MSHRPQGDDVAAEQHSRQPDGEDTDLAFPSWDCQHVVTAPGVRYGCVVANHPSRRLVAHLGQDASLCFDEMKIEVEGGEQPIADGHGLLDVLQTDRLLGDPRMGIFRMTAPAVTTMMS
jgi:hypothetical protein